MSADLSLREAADQLGLGKTSVLRLIDMGHVPAHMESGRIWIRPDDLAAFAATYVRGQHLNRRPKADPLARIMPRVEQRKDGCWIYTGYRTPAGYGQVWDGWRRNAFAHRVVYEAMVGPIPAGLQLDHLCRNRACCNPVHLEPVTRRENLLRGEGAGARAARATHCPQGHAYVEDNIYRRPDRPERRDCLACRRWRSTAAYRRSREQVPA